MDERDALDLIEQIGEVAIDLNRVLVRQGYQLQPTTRPYCRQDGSVLVRFVWRRRHAAFSVVQSLVVPRAHINPEVSGDQLRGNHALHLQA